MVSNCIGGKGLPDISLIQPLAGALGVSVIELLSGDAFRCAAREYCIFTATATV